MGYNNQIKRKKMKKTYIKPIVESFEVNVESIIALSLTSSDTEQIQSGSEGNYEVLGREDNSVSNIWDSEW